MRQCTVISGMAIGTDVDNRSKSQMYKIGERMQIEGEEVHLV